MRLVQLVDRDGIRRVAISDHDSEELQFVNNVTTVYELAVEAIRTGKTMLEMIQALGTQGHESFGDVESEGRLLVPLDHPDPAHCLISGTGLTHLGSANTRDRMHHALAKARNEPQSESMRMFLAGIEGGKPDHDRTGAQPEWFYKGNGRIVVPSGRPLVRPAFGEDGGEEAEIAGLYVISNDGVPQRLGFAIGNEFSDHITERQNYLLLAHSKLLPCSLGPELTVGRLPSSITGQTRIQRDGKTLWEKEFLTGEDNMCHSIANLEYHHFKYPQHRHPGDVHIHFFGAPALSFSDGVKLETNDTIEIDIPMLGRPLRNRVTISPAVKPAIGTL
jgi:hypothetical protein